MQDTSIFQGIIEFAANDGRKIRAESITPTIYQIRILEDGAWICQGKVQLSGKPTPNRILGAMDDFDLL